MSWQLLLVNPWVIGATVGLLATGLAFVAGRLLLNPAGPKPGWTGADPKDVDAFTEEAPSDRRLAYRRGGNPVEVDFIDPQGVQPPVVGWVVDRSIGGLCVNVERPLTVGQELKVKIRATSASVAAVLVEVKSCRADGVGWKVGCQFVKPPSFNVMLLFG